MLRAVLVFYLNFVGYFSKPRLIGGLLALVLKDGARRFPRTPPIAIVHSAPVLVRRMSI
jgi:hypothetical protein